MCILCNILQIIHTTAAACCVTKYVILIRKQTTATTHVTESRKDGRAGLCDISENFPRNKRAELERKVRISWREKCDVREREREGSLSQL